MEDKKYTLEDILNFFVIIGKIAGFVLLFLWFGWKLFLVVLLLMLKAK